MITTTTNPFKIVSITRRPNGTGRIYIDITGESLWEHLENRRCRPYTLYRKFLVPEFVAKYPEFANYRISWSQYAGCSCPCSPGFILKPPANLCFRSIHDDFCIVVKETDA